jgi:protein involved in polysaccharide export with SLBB domain
MLSGFGVLPERQELVETASKLRLGPVDGVPRELDAVALGEYVVGSGDGLLAIPVNLESPARVPSDLMVQPDGIIDLGQYGPLRVVGKTVVQIEAEVNALVAAQTPGAGFIDVRLVNRESKKFYVAGEVNAPGSFPYTGEETVLDAVTAAGGLNEKASRWDIILSRPTPPNGCRVILAVNYWDILQLGDTTTNYKLLPGDRVYVPTRTLMENLCGGGKKFWKWERRPQVSCPLPPLETTRVAPAECPPHPGQE